MEINNSRATIYRLKDPRDGSTRYVGKTTQELHYRLAGHCSTANRSNNRLKQWVCELKSVNLRPIIESIEDCSRDSVNEREIHHISSHWESGCKLLNVLRGGDGSTPESFTEDIKAALSRSLKRHFALPGSRERHGKILKVAKSTPEARENSRRAMIEVHSRPEVLQKNRDQATARMADPSRRQAVSDDRKEFFASEENRKRQSAIISSFYASNPEARELARQKTILQFSDPAVREESRKKTVEYNAAHPNKCEKQWKSVVGIPIEDGCPVQFPSLHAAAKAFSVSVGAIFNSLKFGGSCAGHRLIYRPIS